VRLTALPDLHRIARNVLWQSRRCSELPVTISSALQTAGHGTANHYQPYLGMDQTNNPACEYKHAHALQNVAAMNITIYDT
jgi:hypothetical protein